MVSRCPTCEGRGILPQGFYSYPAGQSFTANHTRPDKCRTCRSSGLVRLTPNKAHPVARESAQ